MYTFTSKGLIGASFKGSKTWQLFEHNTTKVLKTYDSFEDCIQDVYSDTITYHRPPTKAEIKFGYGAIHYADFCPLDCVKPSGELKKWFISPYDNLRYYR